MRYDEWPEILARRFPQRDSSQIELEWSLLKDRVAVWQSVTGTVLAKAPFGAWIDIGVGFPSLLLIPEIAGLSPKQYQADEWCPIGSEVTAWVRGFNDPHRQIVLTQKQTGVVTGDAERE
jgi:hypothetical protein